MALHDPTVIWKERVWFQSKKTCLKKHNRNFNLVAIWPNMVKMLTEMREGTQKWPEFRVVGLGIICRSLDPTCTGVLANVSATLRVSSDAFKRKQKLFFHRSITFVVEREVLPVKFTAPILLGEKNTITFTCSYTASNTPQISCWSLPQNHTLG